MNEKVKQTQYEVKPARRYLKKGEVPITQKSLDEAIELIQNKDKYIAKLKAKLKPYKDLEKELGIDLITFVKLNKTYKIYDKEEESFMYWDYIDFKNKRLVCVDDWDEMGYTHLEYYYYFKDYGKKWTLTKEELKKYGKIN